MTPKQIEAMHAALDALATATGTLDSYYATHALPIFETAEQLLREALAEPEIEMKDWLPQGYEPHEIPPDYGGPLFLESQMRYAFDQGRLDCDYIEQLEKENFRLNAELEAEIQKRFDGNEISSKEHAEVEKQNEYIAHLECAVLVLRAEVEQYRQEWVDCSIKLENLRNGA